MKEIVKGQSMYMDTVDVPWRPRPLRQA